MLSKGFLEIIKKLLSLIPNIAQNLLFSATMPQDFIEMTNKFMTNPVKILIKNEEITLEGIKQYFVYIKKEDKLDVLFQIYRAIEIGQAIIYCNTKKMAETLSEEMKKKVILEVVFMEI